jgi:hypothetical protein
VIAKLKVLLLYSCPSQIATGEEELPTELQPRLVEVRLEILRPFRR